MIPLFFTKELGTGTAKKTRFFLISNLKDRLPRLAFHEFPAINHHVIRSIWIQFTLIGPYPCSNHFLVLLGLKLTASAVCECLRVPCPKRYGAKKPTTWHAKTYISQEFNCLGPEFPNLTQLLISLCDYCCSRFETSCGVKGYIEWLPCRS